MALRILVVEDDPLVRRVVERHLKSKGVAIESAESVEEARRILRESPGFHAVITDLSLPDGHGLDALNVLPEAQRPRIIVMTGDATIDAAIGAIRSGAMDYLLKPFSIEALDAAISRVITGGPQGMTERPVLPQDVAGWRGRYAPAIVGEHPSLVRVFDLLQRVADTDCSVLIQGETGTGKELIARSLHLASGRGKQPFVAVNCAAVPEQLIESELFGHSKGAFTGATAARVGRFQAAHKGTLFLDEIGDLPLAMQAKLLRALQEKEITPLGESRPIQIDARVVAATHRDLEDLARERKFREDLLYRLDVIRVELPALRERRSDIALLAQSFVRMSNEKRSREVSGISAAALEVLSRHDWPGNIRQLQNVIERTVLLRGAGEIEVEDLEPRLRGEAAQSAAASLSAAPQLPDDGLDLRNEVDRFETALIRQALERTGGNKNQAAAILQMNRTTLIEKIKRKGWDEGGEDS